ncbi:hypothetical protein FRB94_009746 [Tulasnella sp. JGI-2019a]|nr:hypothetical protein FRB94_009746 [Tulasnella sp. JGI-2019a]
MNINNSTLTPNDLAPAFVVGKGAVRQNCTFFASLCCSLLAATGAMLAKQWLQEYARTGQSGSVEEQARRRADKFRGAEQWGLRLVVEALPTLLLISLGLFFVGLVDYLWTVDRTVSLVALAFTVVGVAFYGFTVVVGVLYTASPFQTAVSTAIRKIQAPLRNIFYSPDFLETRSPPYAFWDPAIRSFQRGARMFQPTISLLRLDLRSYHEDFLSDLLKALPEMAWTVISPIVLLVCLLIWPVQVSDIDELDASSVIWMAETAPDPKDLLIVAENIPFITNIDAMQLIAHSSAFSLLLSKFTETFMAAQHSHTDTNVADAITMARAVACILLADPERCWSEVRMACIAGFGDMDGERRWVRDWASDYGLLFRAIFGVCDHWYHGHESKLRLALDVSPHHTIKSSLDATIYLRYCIQSGFDDLEDGDWLDDRLSSALLVDERNVDATYPSCVSRTLSRLLRRRLGDSETLSSRVMVELAWMKQTDLPSDIYMAVSAFSDYYELVAGRPPATPTEPPKLLTQMLRFHRHLPMQLRSPYPAFEALPQSSAFIDNLRYVLDDNIKWLLALEDATLLPAEETALVDCRDEAIAVMDRFLVAGGSHYFHRFVEMRGITNTASSVGVTCSVIESILHGLLYRYFLLVVGHLPPEQQRGARMAHLQNRSIAQVLTSALRFYIWLYPENVGIGTVRGDAWSAFSSAFMYMIGNGMDGTGSALPVQLDTEDHSDMWEALVTAARRHDIVTYEGVGPSLMWLAESMHLIPAENWVDGREGGRFVQLFRRVIKGQGAEGTVAELSTRIWNRDDEVAAGVLFLRAWNRARAVSLDGPATHELSTVWTSAPAIEAFKIWLGCYHGHTTVEIKHENIVLLSATVNRDDIFGFAHHALKINPEAAIVFGLHEAVDGFIQKLEALGEPIAESREQVERWRTDVEEALVQVWRWSESHREDATAPQRWAGNGLSRVCGTARLMF